MGGVNGNTPELIDVPPPMKSFKTIEEEDPYEKIEIKKNKDVVANIKPTKDAPKHNKEIPKGKKEKQKSSQKSESTEISKSKQTSQKTKTSTEETSMTISSQIEKTAEKKELKAEMPQTNEKKIKVQSIDTKAGDCVHDVKIIDYCNKCSEDQEHKTFDRAASLAPQASQEGDIKGSGKGKQINNERGIEMKTEIKNQNESETSSKKKPTARKLEHSNSCIHDVTLEDFCKGCTDNQKSLDRKSTKKTKEEKTASLEGSMIKEITNREEEKNIKGEIQVDKVNIESTKEIKSIDKSKSKESKTQTTQVLKESCKECVHDISISDFCKGCADNQSLWIDDHQKSLKKMI